MDSSGDCFQNRLHINQDIPPGMQATRGPTAITWLCLGLLFGSPIEFISTSTPLRIPKGFKKSEKIAQGIHVMMKMLHKCKGEDFRDRVGIQLT